MRVGLVCPYSFHVPGGVQFHIRDLAAYVQRQGHAVSVLAPTGEDDDLPDYVVSAGRALPVPYNGSVARLAFGPVASSRVRRWLADGEFDVIHLHEPQVPSLSLMALLSAHEPLVATFHTSIARSRALQAAYPMLRPSMEKLLARIAVSEDARRTLVDHLGGDAVVIPNGVDTGVFAQATPDPRWIGTPERPTVAFLGRIDEPRKGLDVLLDALPAVRARHQGLRVVIAGRGDVEAVNQRAAALGVAASVEVLGGISEQDKLGLLAACDLYIAPQLGGESFGIVLVEAMSAGAVVVASDLPAFARVLDYGGAGRLFETGQAGSLAEAITGLLAAPTERDALRARAAERVGRYDWSTVAEQVLTVYSVAMQHGRQAET